MVIPDLSHFSAFIWAKAPFESYLIGQYDTGFADRGWLIGTGQANEKRMRVLFSDNGTYAADHSKDYLTTADVFDNTWHFYGFDWNAGTLRLDIDGMPQAVTKTYDAPFVTVFKSSSDVAVGCRLINGAPTGYYTGEIGEYYIIGRSTSPAESSILYNETRKFYGR